MAREAGYENHAAACEVAPEEGELRVDPAHTALDLLGRTGDEPGDWWWECPVCGDYAWVPAGEEHPECSCHGHG